VARGSETTRSIVVSLGANVAIAVVKLVGALMTGSGSMLAEALHSVADSGNEALLLWGRREAKQPPTATHPLGQGRATYFWSFIVALLLFSMGGVASVYEGIRKLSAGETVQSPWLAIGILVFAAVAEAISLYVPLRQINRVRGKRSLWHWFRTTRRSELIIVFGENAAALAGLGVALVAILLTIVTGDPVYDAVGSMVIGGLLVVVALAIAAQTKSLLIGESASPRVRHDIKAFLRAWPGVAAVREFITLQHGEDVFVAVKAELRGTPSTREFEAAIAACEAGLKAAFPEVRWIFFEPSGETLTAEQARQ
jgi:cation diffusion facilitator family transporter